MKAKYIIISIASALMLMGTGVSAEASTLFEGRKWSYSTLSGMSSGQNQGMAYYNGVLYQFKGNRGYDKLACPDGTTTQGTILDAINSKNHMGSASFGKKVWTIADGYTYDCTIPFVYLTGHYDSKEVIAVVDIENNNQVAVLTFPNLQDDAIAAYDFDNNKVWMVGYPTGIGMSPWTIREFNVPLNVCSYSQTDFNYVSETVVGGPDADGIQRSLDCGALQDAFYKDGNVYFLTGRGSSYLRTEWVKIHSFNTSSKTLGPVVIVPDCNEAQGLTCDESGNIYCTVFGGGSSKLWKYTAGTGYDNNNFEPATLVSANK